MEIIEDPRNPGKSSQMMWEEAVLGSPRKAWEGLVSYQNPNRILIESQQLLDFPSKTLAGGEVCSFLVDLMESNSGRLSPGDNAGNRGEVPLGD